MVLVKGKESGERPRLFKRRVGGELRPTGNLEKKVEKHVEGRVTFTSHITVEKFIARLTEISILGGGAGVIVAALFAVWFRPEGFDEWSGRFFAGGLIGSAVVGGLLWVFHWPQRLELWIPTGKWWNPRSWKIARRHE
jgi:hypothetical protein